MNIAIILEAPDKLGREIWKFRVDDNAGEQAQIGVKLIYWANQTRPTRRHGWQIIGKHFDTYDRDSRDPANAPNVPDHVWTTFKDEYMRRLTYTGVWGAGG